MIDIDEIDNLWRDALASAATDAPPVDDPRPRVARRVQHNRRVRTFVNSSVAVVIAGALVVAIGVLVDRPDRHPAPLAGTTQTTVVAVTTVRVVDATGGSLSISFPGQPSETIPPQITVPAGPVNFVIDLDAAGHTLVLDGVPEFTAVNADASLTTPVTVTREVTLAPGRYLLHCLTLGHTEAGEEAMVIVQ